MAKTEPVVEPQPLWEYPSIATSSPVRVADFDLNAAIPKSALSWSNRLRLERYLYRSYSAEVICPLSDQALTQLRSGWNGIPARRFRVVS